MSVKHGSDRVFDTLPSGYVRIGTASKRLGVSKDRVERLSVCGLLGLDCKVKAQAIISEDSIEDLRTRPFVTQHPDMLVVRMSDPNVEEEFDWRSASGWSELYAETTRRNAARGPWIADNRDAETLVAMVGDFVVGVYRIIGKVQIKRKTANRNSGHRLFWRYDLEECRNAYILDMLAKKRIDLVPGWSSAFFESNTLVPSPY